ncbi:MAG: MBL fold metallo-hydrolase [Alcaligenaceae bacterium]|nr:MAG: MBL fold metallo-hydrolase [Alcaligenaceae bacterium]
MKITHFGHACVLVEVPLRDKTVQILIDPGTYSRDFEDLLDIDLVLITHSHPDHVDSDRLRALFERNPDSDLVYSAGAEATLASITPSGCVARPGDILRLRGVEIAVTGGDHACIHPDLPGCDNNGYLVGGSLFHPGDSLETPPFDVDTLLLPAGGPWMKLSEGIDFLRAVGPRVAIPIHQAGLATVHQNMHHQLLTKLAPNKTEVIVLDHATSHALGPRQEVHG